MALDNLRLLSERREHETHDPLTGLLNFRQLRERAAFELARAERHGRTVAFVMLDLDEFAAVNETAGREGGDEVLRHWAAALTAQLRSCDLVCRYGADEFLLVLPETADQQADAALARVLGAMQQLAVETGGPADRAHGLGRRRELPATTAARAEELVAKAATTMYTARAAGPGPRRLLLRPAARAERRRVAARVEILAVGSLHRDLEPAARHYLDLLRPLHDRRPCARSRRCRCAAAARPRCCARRAGACSRRGRRRPSSSALAVDGRALDTEAFAALAAAGVRARRRGLRHRRLAGARGRGAGARRRRGCRSRR